MNIKFKKLNNGIMDYLKLRIGTLDWNCVRIECYLCKTKNANYILYCAKFLEWLVHYAVCKIIGLNYIYCVYGHLEWWISFL